MVFRSISTNPTVRAANTASLCSSTCAATWEHAATLSNASTCHRSKRGGWMFIQRSRISERRYRLTTAHTARTGLCGFDPNISCSREEWQCPGSQKRQLSWDSEPGMFDMKNGRQRWIQMYQYICGRKGVACREFPACRQLACSRYMMPVPTSHEPILSCHQNMKKYISPVLSLYPSPRDSNTPTRPVVFPRG